MVTIRALGRASGSRVELLTSLATFVILRSSRCTVQRTNRKRETPNEYPSSSAPSRTQRHDREPLRHREPVHHHQSTPAINPVQQAQLQAMSEQSTNMVELVNVMQEMKAQQEQATAATRRQNRWMLVGVFATLAVGVVVLLIAVL